MISPLLFFFLSLMALMSQAGWMHGIQIAGVMPNLVMAVVVSYSVLEGRYKGGLVGLLSGLMQDILFCRVWGFYSALYFLCAVCSASWLTKVHRKNMLVPLVHVFLCELCAGIAEYIVYRFFAGDLKIGLYFASRIMPETVYTLMWTLAVYPISYFLCFLTDKADRKVFSRKA